MSELTYTYLTGVSCDIRDCDTRRDFTDYVPVFSREAKNELNDALTAGWVRYANRGIRWYCPDHADKGRACKAPGTFTQDWADRIAAGEPWPQSACGSDGCPVHARRPHFWDADRLLAS